MRKLILFLLSLKVSIGVSQIMETKDSCINANTVSLIKEFPSEWLSLKWDWKYDQYVFLTNRTDFDRFFRRNFRADRDSIASRINFTENNMLVFYVTCGGCMPPTITVGYFDNRQLQVKIEQIGICAPSHHNDKYIVIPKNIPLPEVLKICKTYSQ